ncbi:MAG: hypothetical protein ABR529_09440 [Actinomycetota bacterium]
MTGGAPLWRKAPVALRHFPGVLLGIVAATTVLGVAGAAAPLFLSSAASRAVQYRIGDVSRWQAGLIVRQPGALSGEDARGLAAWDAFAARDEALRRAAARSAHLGAPVVTVLGRTTTVQAPGGGGRAVDARLVTRSGATGHVDMVAGLEGGEVHVGDEAAAAPFRRCAGRAEQTGAGPAVWLADSVAESAGVCPGDEVVLGAAAPARVEGVYRNLRTVAPDPFWDLLAPEYEPEGTPAFALTDLRTFAALSGHLGGEGLFRWELPVQGEGLSLEGAQDAEKDLRTLIRDIRAGRGELGALFPERAADSLLLDIGRNVEHSVERARTPVTFLALGGTLLALGVTAAAGVYGLQRRRVEYGLLLTRGVSPTVLGARASLEALLPSLGGGVVGWGLCALLVKALGPSAVLGGGALRAALAIVAPAVVLGVVLLGVATAAALDTGSGTRATTLRSALAAIPWDVALVALAIATLRRLRDAPAGAAGSATAPVAVDILVFALPFMLVAGASGVATRALRRVLPRLRSAGTDMPTPLLLAARRLAAASGIALTLVALAAVSVGVFVYAGALAASGRATVAAKALTIIGSDVAVPMPPSPTIPEGLDLPATLVTKVPSARLKPSLIGVDVLAIDPATFADAAFWDGSFASESLQELVQRVSWRPQDGDAVPAIAVGGRVPRRPTLDHAGSSSALEIVATARSWPGFLATRPLIVLSQRALLAPARQQGGTSLAGASARAELWVDGDPERVLRVLGGAGLSVGPALTVTDVLDAPSLLSTTWSFGFLQALGGATGAMALVGMILYLQARQSVRVVAGALAARMGLARRAHAVAVAVELASMLAVSFTLGTALSVLAADLVLAEIDPLPSVPPAPLLRLPLGAIALIGVLALLAAAAGAWWVQRAAARADVAEVLRVAS